HSHPNSILSGVLYLDVPEGSGEIQFDKPDNYHNWINTDTLRFMVNEWHEYNCDAWRIPPQAGEMLIFPSHLKHQITVNVTKESRWSLSFDCFLEGLLDSGDSATRGPNITRLDGERMADLPYPP
ncbi:MAG: TIGR02466 family protein, partial [Candidatus Poribacteria bacterium]|nr:TIGR02466 family protein [Candidatus Poribacteria bacterium]